jgi:hypothetical protein
MSDPDQPDVRRCPWCGLRVVVLEAEGKLMHEKPTCPTFAAEAGKGLHLEPATELDLAVARAAVGDTRGRA